MILSDVTVNRIHPAAPVALDLFAHEIEKFVHGKCILWRMRERMPSNQHPSVISAANVETISTSCRDDAFMTEALSDGGY